jgi:predicted ATPase/signal transduction histidine kinase/CheY-like chemotaxis protein
MDQLTIPNKLYGRGRDIITLLETFERVSFGHGELLLVPGSSGVGKTALVQELQIPIRDRNGFFIRGKFDQYQQNIPYFAFRQALTELCRTLQWDTQQRSRFKADILQSIGNMGQVLVDLVPELESFLGVQSPLGGISPQEARYRLADVFRKFLKAICRPEHPLVLFIDDWQWADAASLELLKQIQAGNTLHYLLLIVSYRDDEVEPGHPLLATVDDLRSHAVPVKVLHVNDISSNDVLEIVSETLKPATEDLEGLATVIHRKTLGNPFFVRSFLSFLHEFHLLWFDKDKNCWQWRIDKTGRVDMPDNLVELFVMKIRRLDAESQNLFSLAACLGNRFDLETLSIISGRPSGECMAMLFADQAKTLLLPFYDGRSNKTEKDIRTPETCMFLHDRVQQAAYTLIEPTELSHILLKIGRLLLASLKPEQLSERLFEVVGDLNAGYALVNDEAEQLKIIGLNITAARKAYAATAYRSALQFYRLANRFLERPGFAERFWLSQHEMAMRLFKERAECEFLEGDRSEAEKCIQLAVAHARTALEKADALNILIVQYTLLARYPEAIAAGRQALNALEINLPSEDYEAARNSEISQVRQELGGRLISSLVELPVMSNPEMLMASKILITMGPPCYRSHQRLWSVIVPKVVNLTLRYGNIPQVGYSHTAFGGLLGWVDNDYTAAKEFGELATNLMTGTFRSATDQSVFYLMIGSSLRHWFKHLRYGTQDYTDAFEIGFRSGNLQYAAYAFGHNMYCLFYQGIPLAGLIQESQRSLEFSRIRLNQWAVDLLEGGLNIFGILSDKRPLFNGAKAWSEEEYLKRVEDHHNIQVTCIYKVLKTFSLLMSGNYDGALALSDETEPLIYTVGSQGLLPWPEHVFARLLILTALYSKAEDKEQPKWRLELDQMMARLRIWADNCPDNFEHKYLLASAELARIDGRALEAMQFFDKAIDAARAGKFLQWEAMANERAHSFWLECGNEVLAHIYWQEAYVCYDRWGADSKVSSMEAEYRTVLAKSLPTGDESGKSPEKLEQEIKSAQAERQIEQLRNYAFQKQQVRQRNEAATQAGELANAVQRLRVESAERKKAEERYAMTLAAVNNGLWDWHVPSGNAFFSTLYYAILGYQDGEFPATYDSWRLLVHPEDIGNAECELRKSVETGIGFDIDLRMRKKNGDWLWVSSRGKTMELDADGKALRMVGTLSDISDRKLLEAEKAKLEEQNRQLQKGESLGRMAGAIAHHFNNNLNVVQGYLEMVIRDLPPGDSRAEKLARAMQASQKASEVSGNLVAYLGQVQNKIETLDLSGICTVILPLLLAEIPKNVALKTDLPSPGPYIRADAKQVQQILSNLVINAWEAIREETGTVRLSVKTVPATDIPASCRHPLGWQPREQRYACMEVSDSGCGIVKKDMENLFDPFFSTKFTGRGLGLSIVLGTVKTHNAVITVGNRIGGGSVFSVFFPLSNQIPLPPPAQIAKAPEIAAGGTVLLVEDDARLREMTTFALVQFGFTVLQARDGVEAVEVFGQHSDEISCLFSDLTMPRMGGWETISALRAIRRDLPVVLASGYDEGIVMAGEHPELPDFFLNKPYDLNKLRDTIRLAMARRAPA